MPMRQPPEESGPVPGVTTPGQLGPTSRVALPGHGALHPHHVAYGDALGDRDDEVEARIHAFEDGVGRESRRHKDRGYGGAGGRGGLGDRIEDRNLVGLVFEELAALARRDAGDDPGAVVERELRMAGAKRARDALDENLGFGSDENGHGVEVRVRVKVKGRESCSPRSE